MESIPCNDGLDSDNRVVDVPSSSSSSVSPLSHASLKPEDSKLSMEKPDLSKKGPPSSSSDVHNETLMSRLSHGSTKAGMQAVDAEHVRQVILENTKGTKFYENELKKSQRVDEKIAKMLNDLKTWEKSLSLSPDAIHHAQRVVDRKVAQLIEKERDLSRTFICFDLDAFYASVEELDRPELKSLPMAVGSIGMLSTSNYVARTFGVRSAMPGFIAKKLCPQLIIVPLHFEKYQTKSSEVAEVLRKYDPHMEMYSLDEAMLDVTQYLHSNRDRSPAKLAEDIRNEVFEKTGLTCSAGISPTKTLAKICSDKNKPNGQFVLPPDEDSVLAFLESLSIRKVPGIGKVTERMLNALGVENLKQMKEKLLTLHHLFSPISFEFFVRSCFGLSSSSSSNASDSTEDGDLGRKSISAERTFSDTSSFKELSSLCSDLAISLSDSLKEEHMMAKTVTLKIKTSAFEVRTRAHSLSAHTQSSSDIEKAALELLQNEMPVELRLLGLRVSNLMLVGGAAGSSSSKNSLDKFLVDKSNSSSSGSRSVSPIEMMDEAEEEQDEAQRRDFFAKKEIEEGQEKQEWTCPICGEVFSSTAVLSVNVHLDDCLAKASAPYATSSSASSKRKSISNFFTASSNDSSKRKKMPSAQSGAGGAGGGGTLDRFFGGRL